MCTLCIWLFLIRLRLASSHHFCWECWQHLGVRRRLTQSPAGYLGWIFFSFLLLEKKPLNDHSFAGGLSFLTGYFVFLWEPEVECLHFLNKLGFFIIIADGPFQEGVRLTATILPCNTHS